MKGSKPHRLQGAVTSACQEAANLPQEISVILFCYQEEKEANRIEITSQSLRHPQSDGRHLNRKRLKVKPLKNASSRQHNIDT
jgi:hypothetical protein